MSGLEVAERIKTSRPWLPVVIVTGYGTEDNEVRAEAAGVSGFLRKPLSPEMIEASARNALVAKVAKVAAPAIEPAAAPEREAETATPSVYRHAKNVALFFAAPFVGLAYILAMPLVGIGTLAWFGAKALMTYPAAAKVMRTLKYATLTITAPILGLAYIIALPFVGIGMLAWFGMRTAVNRYARK
jgi:CheY-like chemotaxis protein